MNAGLPLGERIVAKYILIFRNQNAVVQAGVRDDDAVERILRPGDPQSPADGSIEILIADSKTDPGRQIGYDHAGINRDPPYFIQKLQLQPDNR
jgi:hypothetical protein